MRENRNEEPWNNRLENYIKHMRDVADSLSHLHEQTGYHFKKRKNWVGLPSVLIPIIMSPISLMLASENSKSLPFVNAFCFMLTGIFTGVYSFFKYGEKMERHFAFSARYADIVTDIEAELIKERRLRVSSDVMTLKVKMSIDNLNNTSPVIPQNLLNKERKIMSKDEYDPIKINISKSASDSKKTADSPKKKLKETITRDREFSALHLSFKPECDDSL
jgi:hypothetical protein